MVEYTYGPIFKEAICEMNTIRLGSTIAKLRKKLGLTQSQLAGKLCVSDKAVSKWETGGGYPEITLLPALSEELGVSVDYLLKGDTGGIAVAGNILVDIVNMIDKYPRKTMLANVLDTTYAVGGCVPNTIISLAKIDPEIFLTAIGKVGNDENGRFVTSQLKKYGIDTTGVVTDEALPTSSSNVMTDITTGERTFFYTGGANKSLCIDDFDVSTLDCKLFHIGYILLLDALDAKDEVYGTKMARLLAKVSERGIKTSIDVISDEGGNFRETVIPALKYCDYAILNETESSLVTGLSPRFDDGRVNVDNIRATMGKFLEYGVREKVIVHCPEAGFLMNADGEFIAMPSLELPSDYIVGSVGAGDAYAAACLYGIYNGYDDFSLLEFAAAAAACNLSASDSISGMRPKNEIMKLCEIYKRRESI